MNFFTSPLKFISHNSNSYPKDTPTMKRSLGDKRVKACVKMQRLSEVFLKAVDVSISSIRLQTISILINSKLLTLLIKFLN